MTIPCPEFDHQPRTRIVFGNGVIDRGGEIARQLGGSRALLVTDPGVRAAGHIERVCRSLVEAGLQVVVFDQVHENPTTRDVEACLETARSATNSGGGRGAINLIVGVGGGSALDTAKGCNFLLTNGGRIADYWGVGKATRPMLPMIAIPTTAGTGSEMQSFALIADNQTHQKMACGDPKAAAAVAILDPVLTTTLPRHVTACTGIDAIAHAIESFVTTRRTELSMMYARQAFKLTISNLPHLLELGGGSGGGSGGSSDLDARGAMLLGAALAGLAIENSMLGAAHAAANPLTAHFDIVHGHAVGIMLPPVIRFNARQAATRAAYAELVRSADLPGGTYGQDDAFEALVEQIENIFDAARLARSPAACGADRSAIDALAKEATRQWTAQFNPRPASKEDFVDLYKQVFGAEN